MRVERIRALATLLFTASLAACGGTGDDAGQTAEQAPATAEASRSDTPQPTGTLIEVRMITDDLGNYFEPAEVEARPGDVIRFMLVSGVHNVSLPADRNPAGLTMPEASDLLQLPGQTWDLAVSLPAGEYYFQCDPHAALGMVGTLTVTN
jgi:plastocyanin